MRLVNAVFYAHHGVTKEEHQLGGRYEVDVAMHFDFEEAAATDRLSSTAVHKLYCLQIAINITLLKTGCWYRFVTTRVKMSRNGFVYSILMIPGTTIFWQ